MKFPAIDKLTKRITYPLITIGLGLYLFIIIICYSNGVDLWKELVAAGIWAAVWAVGMVATFILSTCWFIWFSSSYVIVDENGIQLRVGRVVMNKLSWNEIKRIEVFEEILPRVTRPIINIMRENKPSRNSQRHKNSANIHKSHFTFMYAPKALELIQKYRQCEIYGLDIAEKYNG